MVTRKNSSRWIALALVFPFLGLATLMVSAGSGQIAPADTQAKRHLVDVSPLEIQDSYVQQRLAFGRIEATNKAQVGFELSGLVKSVLVDEGDKVSAGDVLAELDTKRLQASLTEVNAAIARAEADARLAKLSEDRVAALVKQSLESSQRLDEARERTNAAKALVKEVQAKRDSIRVEVSKSRLVAGFDARIVSRPVDAGTVVAAGQPIFSLRAEAGLDVRIALPDNQAFHMEIGQSYPLKAGSTQVTGIVKSIANERSLMTRTVDVLFSLNTQQGQLMPGDMVSFSYDHQVSEAGAWVPREALSSGIRGLWTLYTVDSQKDASLSVKSVEMIYAEEHRAYIRGPIADGQMFVINGTQRLVPGQLVDVRHVADSAFAKGTRHE